MEKSYENLLRNILKNRKSATADENDGEKVVLESHRFKPTQGLLSSALFVGLRGGNSTGASRSLFFKMDKEADGMESFNIAAFFNEAYFYSKIAPFLHTFADTANLFPTYLGSSLNASSSAEKCAMLAENVQTAGYQHTSSKCRWDYPHLMLAVQKLGQFHAFSYKAKAIDSSRFYSHVSNLTNTIESFAIMILGTMNRYLKRVLDCVKQEEHFMATHNSSVIKVEYILENMLSELQKQFTVDPDVSDNLVLCHGDLTTLNFMFQYHNGDPKSAILLDFANCTLGHPSLDLLYFLYCATDQPMRDDHWDDLIDHYYAALSGTFPDNAVPTRSSIVDEFSRQGLFPALVAIHYTPYLMAIDERAENIPRNLPLLDLEKIGETKLEEGALIFKDIIRRGII